MDIEIAASSAMPRVGLAVLAGGASRRMGFCKLTAPFAGTTLLGHALDVAAGADIDEIFVVSGAYDDEVRSIAAEYGVSVIANSHWAQGQSASVALAARHALDSGLDALVIMVADQPFLESKHIDALMDAYLAVRGHPNIGDPSRAHEHVSLIWRSWNGAQKGTPCLFDRDIFVQLTQLDGDEGARVLMQARPQRVIDVMIDNPHALDDVDTPADLVRAQERLSLLGTDVGSCSVNTGATTREVFA